MTKLNDLNTDDRRLAHFLACRLEEDQIAIEWMSDYGRTSARFTPGRLEKEAHQRAEMLELYVHIRGAGDPYSRTLGLMLQEWAEKTATFYSDHSDFEDHWGKPPVLPRGDEERPCRCTPGENHQDPENADKLIVQGLE